MVNGISERELTHTIVVSGLVESEGGEDFAVKENDDPNARKCQIQSASEEAVALTGLAKGELFIAYMNPVTDIEVNDKIVDQDGRRYKVAGVEHIFYGRHHTKISMTVEA